MKIIPTIGMTRNAIPEMIKAIPQFLYKEAISLLYSGVFLTLYFKEVSPLQKLIGSLLSFSYTEIIKNGKEHMKQETRPMILPIIINPPKTGM